MRRSLKWALGVVGAIVVGALGSGLWSTVFAPVGSFLLKMVLSIVTLGIEAARDSVYRQAAFGFRERAGDILLIAFAALVLFIPVFLYPIRRNPSGPGNAKTRRRINHVALICLALTSSILSVQLLMNVYSNKIVANFHRTLAVAAPHISSEQRSVYLARFAKVRTRRDFITLLGDLDSVLENNREPRSDFSPW
jgi:hypothetical protein